MYERFLILLQERGCKVADVAKKTGIHPSTFTDWKKGKSSPKYDKIKKIADYFEVEADWLSGKSDFKTKREMLRAEFKPLKIERGTKIPVLGYVAAGTPIFAEENYIETEEISNELAATGDFFALKIKGDSMAPRISEGDTVIVRKQDDAESGDIVIVLINGCEATCKRLMKYKDSISLISFNPAYEPRTYTENEVKELPVKIIGKVVENRQKY